MLTFVVVRTQPHGSGSMGGPGGPRGGGSGARSNGHSSASPSSWTRPFSSGGNGTPGGQQASGTDYLALSLSAERVEWVMCRPEKVSGVFECIEKSSCYKVFIHPGMCFSP